MAQIDYGSRHVKNCSGTDGEAAVIDERRLGTSASNRNGKPIGIAHLSALHLTFNQLRAQRVSLLSNLRALVDETLSCSQRIRDEWQLRESNATSLRAPQQLQQEYGMTPREVEVAQLLAEGLSNAALACRLGVSPHTARHHTQRVLGKLGVHSRAEAGARLRR
jgi:DNA-binding CsgD family transcriptional regulator